MDTRKDSEPTGLAQAGSDEAHFRAGFLAGCSYGMDQTKEYQRDVPDAPDVNEAWEIHQGREEVECG